MYHERRWTAAKIQQRITLVESLVYRWQVALPPFRFLRLAGPESPPPTGLEVDDSDWKLVEAGSYRFCFKDEFHSAAGVGR